MRREEGSGENPDGGGIMKIPHIKPNGVLNSVGSDDRQLLGSPPTSNATNWKRRALPCQTVGCGSKESTKQQESADCQSCKPRLHKVEKLKESGDDHGSQPFPELMKRLHAHAHCKYLSSRIHPERLHGPCKERSSPCGCGVGQGGAQTAR